VTPGFVVFALVLLGASILGTMVLPRIWHDAARDLECPQSWWVFGEEGWRGFRRAMPVAILSSWIISIGVAILPFVPRRPPESFIWAVPILVAGVIAFGLICTVWFWNWPKFVVPPHLRHERGTLSGVFSRRR